MLKEAREGLKATVDNRVTTDYHFIHIVFCYFLFLQPEPCFPQQAILKSMPAHIGHCGPQDKSG